MKQFIQISLLCLLMSMAGIQAFAYDIAVENADGVTIYYNYINNNSGLEVTWSDKSCYINWGNLKIPQSVVYDGKTYSVTRIGVDAFRACDDLYSVVIPNSVKEISGFAFYGCRSLTTVSIGNKVSSIGDMAFYSCGMLSVVNIPNSVKSIEASAFEGCSSLTSVVFPNSIVSIGSKAFCFCI